MHDTTICFNSHLAAFTEIVERRNVDSESHMGSLARLHNRATRAVLVSAFGFTNTTN